MEDQDPELVMNPVLLARMEMEKAKAQGRGGKKGKGGGGPKTGGLARLGLKISAEAEVQKAKVPITQQMDEYLAANMGVTTSTNTEAASKEVQKKIAGATTRAATQAANQDNASAARVFSREKSAKTEAL